MKNIHELSLVLMQTLYLHVENGVRVNVDSVMLLNVLCQAHLVFTFNLHNLFLRLRVICHLNQTLNL